MRGDSRFGLSDALMYSLRDVNGERVGDASQNGVMGGLLSYREDQTLIVEIASADRPDIRTQFELEFQMIPDEGCATWKLFQRFYYELTDASLSTTSEFLDIFKSFASE